MPATTPSPLPTPTPTPPTQVATLSGLIRDGADGNPLALVREFGYVNVTTRTSVDWILPRACAPGFGPTPQVLVQSDSIEFSWSLRTPSGQLRYPGVTDFLLEVGRYREGTSGNFTSPDLLSVTTGGTGFYKWHTPGMAAGEYWARLRLKNDCGIGRYSPPASFTWH